MASIPATFIMSRQAIEFDQLNHPRVNRVAVSYTHLTLPTILRV